jgi:hypothetical protein
MNLTPLLDWAIVLGGIGIVIGLVLLSWWFRESHPELAQHTEEWWEAERKREEHELSRYDKEALGIIPPNPDVKRITGQPD